MDRPARIACIVAEGFEDSELKVPYDRLREAGHQVTLIGEKPGVELAGKKGKETIRTDRGIDDVSPAEFDLLFIPGGHSPDKLRADERFVDFVRAFDEADKPIAAVCHGPQLLMAADLVEGRTLTAWKTVQADLRLAGVDVKDEPVVIDQNWITSRKPEDLPQFCDAILQAIGELRPGDQPSHLNA